MKQLIFTTLALILTCNFAAGQTSLSPYSRFAFGDFIAPGGAAQLGIGGLGAAWIDRSSINAANPAAASFLHRTSFQSGLGVHSLKLTEGSSSGSGQFGGLDAVSLVLKKRSGRGAFQFGVRPLSGSGYSITDKFEQDGIGEVEISYTGEGGLSAAHVGWSYRWDGQRWRLFGTASGTAIDSVRVIAHGTALGVHVQQIFGDLVQTRFADIIDPGYLDTQVKRSALHRGLGLKLGFVHERLISATYDQDRKLRSSTLLRIGATASPSFGLKVEEFIERTTAQNLNGVVTQIDSVEVTSSVSTADFPLIWTVGFILERSTASGRRLELGVELGLADWTANNTSNPDLLDPGVHFAEASHRAIGFSYTPRHVEDSSTLLERSTYRAGYRQSSGYLTFDQHRALRKVLSLGLTAPMLGSRSGSQFHFGIDFGERFIEGDSEALRESITTLRFGVSLSPFFKNVWLVPRRYD